MSAEEHKGCPPRVARIGVVDDDESARETLVKLVRAKYPRVLVKGFETLFAAYEGVTTYDYILIDISAVSPAWTMGREWAPISKYAQEYPRTEFVIISAMSRNAINDVIDDCVEHGGIARERFHIGGFMWTSSDPRESLDHNLSRLISKEDTEWTKLRRKSVA